MVRPEIQTTVYDPCLAAKGQQALSQLLQPLSRVRLWWCVHSFDLCSDTGSLSLSLSLSLWTTWGSLVFRPPPFTGRPSFIISSEIRGESVFITTPHIFSPLAS